MKKVNIYIDGFNVYHVLKNNIKYGVPAWEKETKWLDLKLLCKSYLGEDEELGEIYYFTADSWIESTRNKGKIYHKALNETGVTIIKGEYNNITKTFMDKMKVLLFLLGVDIGTEDKNKFLPKILKYKTYEEKRTDVNIAVKILEDAFLGKYQKAIIMSGDSDIVPAIETVKKNFPQTEFMTLWINGTKGQIIKDRCDFHAIVGYRKIKEHQFPGEIKTTKGEIIKMPEEWRTKVKE